MPKPNNDAIDFRWLQRTDDEGNPVGAPVLQWRYKFEGDVDGRFAKYWEWTDWQDVRTEEE